MNVKKLLACACASALALSLTIPAFAAGSPITNPNQTTFTGDVAANAGGTVSVRLRTGSTKLYVNPYGASYKLENGEVMVGSEFDPDTDLVIVEGSTAAGFFSDTAVIENNSESALKVAVTLTTTTKGTTKVVTSSTASATDNTLYGNFEITSATLSTGRTKVTGSSGKVDMDGVSIVTPNWSDTNKKILAIPSGGASAGTAGNPSSTTAGDEYVLAAAQRNEDIASGTVTITPGYAAYRLTGSAVIGSSANTWNNNDLADVAVSFKFTPST